MTPQEFAEQIDGREYPFQLDEKEKTFAKQQGLVVVHGASDDLMEFDGAICDEFGCFEGGIAQVDKYGLFDSWDTAKDCMDTEEEFKDYFDRKRNAKQIEAVWGKDDISWQYKTDIPHSTFKIMEDGEVYCIGMVFDIKELEA